MPGWPLARITTLIANSVPVIAAALVDAIEDWVVALSTGTVSLLALVVDGTGGQAVTPVAGTVTVGAALGTGATKDGVAYRDLMVFANAQVLANGNIYDNSPNGGPATAHNIATNGTIPPSALTGAGVYQFLTKAAPAWLTSSVSDGTAIFFPYALSVQTGTGFALFYKEGGSSPVVKVVVTTYNLSSAATNLPFSLILYP